MKKAAMDIPGPLGHSFLSKWRGRWRVGFQSTTLHLMNWLLRGFDLLMAGLLLTVLSPVCLVMAVLSLLLKGRVFEREPMLGRQGRPFDRLRFASPQGGLSGIAVLFNILAGDMSLVGPRPLTWEEVATSSVRPPQRFELRPGLVSTFTLRRRIGIAYEDESELDEDFFYEESLGGNAALLGRALIGRAIAGGRSRRTPDRFVLLGCPIVNTTMGQALDWISEQLQGDTPRMAAFVNPDCLNIACRNPAYLDALRQSDVVWPDGIGINVGLRLLDLALKDNVNGTDLFPRLCERLAAEGRSVYLLGARPGIAEQAARNMANRYPGLRIAGARDGYFTADEEGQVIEEIRRSGADLLLTAFGAPRQELWLNHHRHRLTPRLVIGVGGLFDFYSGRIPRAPVWMREIGMEWTWRLLQEPGRMWRRYLIGNPLFLYRVYRQKRQEKRI